MTLRRTTAVDAPSPYKTTHRHNASPLTRPRHRIHAAGAAPALVTRNRPHPFKCCRRRRRCGRAIVLQYRRLLRVRVVTIYAFLWSARWMCVGGAC